MRKYLAKAAVYGCLLVTGCYHVKDEDDVEKQAYIPVYANEATYRKVSFAAAKPVKNAGKIVLHNNLLFQVEQDSGIHVFDVTNPASPKRLGFISSPLCKELAIKNNHIITNNIDDMVVIDFSNPAAMKEVNRLAGQFPEMKLQYPTQTGVYFECPDPSKGVITGWKLGMVKNPKCSH